MRLPSRYIWILACCLAGLPALAQTVVSDPPPESIFNIDLDYNAPDTTTVPSSDIGPVPTARWQSSRNTIAPEYAGGWTVYEGDLHAHSRGHGDNDPNINRTTVNVSAWFFGYDFFSITNHTTSWRDYDGKAPLCGGFFKGLSDSTFVFNQGQSGASRADMSVFKGIENYLGPNNESHFSVFNNLFRFNNSSLDDWHDEIIEKYHDNPIYSTHVQLNHLNSPGPMQFQLPSASDPTRRRIVRDATELVEYFSADARNDFFEILRRGFRVSPVSNMDGHSKFRPANAEKNPDGTWKEPYLEQPGIPIELWSENHEPKRTGILLPANQQLTYYNLLEAMRARRTLRTSVVGASGFFTVNGRPMGSEFALQPGENQLDFTVWATTKDGFRGAGNEWQSLEVWSPFQPDDPLLEISYNDPSLVSLKQTFSLPASESIYVIRLQQARSPRSEVILAPIWITNPVPRDGSLLSRPDGQLYVVAGGAPFLFASHAEAQALGYDLSQVRPDTTGFYNHAFGSRLRDGALLRFGGSDARYVAAGGGLFWATGGTSWEAYKSAAEKSESDVVVLPRGYMPQSVRGPRDGTLVREEGKTAIWVYQGGGRFWATGSSSWESYSQAMGAPSVQLIPSGSLSAFIVDANGQDQYRLREDVQPSDGTLVREVGKTAIWVYQGGGRFWATGSSSWDSYSQATGLTNVRPIPFGSLSAYLVDVNGVDQYRRREDTRPRDGTLVREVNSTQTWVYQGGGSFLFPNATELSLWPDPQTVRYVPEGSLSALLMGDANYQDYYQVRDDLPADGTLLRERTGTQVYQVVNQRKSPVSGHDPAQVKLVPDGSSDRVPNG
ncbi:hypothetical protein ACN28E_24350 [Archangium lansingense]|uniref:hypothetical protein n=1 Tax=Archangium lansingense TaxID=2995310 RepID=UPI003B7C5454